MYLNEKNKLFNSEPDQRVRRRMIPQRIVLTNGTVHNSETLTKEFSDQITLDASEVCTLENIGSNDRAGVLIDFGIEFNGTLKLMVFSVTNGDSQRADVLIRTGESVAEALAPIGFKNATNDHATRERVFNVGFLSANETNESGFRFAYIELCDKNAKIEIKAVTATAIYRDLEYLGSFECNDALLNKIWETSVYTVHVNMQNYLWDGIKRDRLVWIGDMHTEVMTILAVFGYHNIVPSSLDLVCRETPREYWMNGISSYSIWWLLNHYEWYLYFGNKEYLEQQHEYIVFLINKLMNYVDENGSEILDGFRFIDWPNSANPEAIHAGLQAMMKLAFDKGTFLLKELGENDLSAKCIDFSEKVSKHIPDCNGSKQAASLLVLSGLQEAERINREVISKGGAKGYSTFFGYYILAAKALAGDMSGALDDIKQYWGAMLDFGATTFWEDFNLEWTENAAPIDAPVPNGKIDIHGDYGAYCYIKFRHSLCHGWASGPAPFLSRTVLGIEVIEPGFKKIKIKPDLGYLTYAKGTYPTPYGIIEISHVKKEDGTIESQYKIPDEIEVEYC